MTATLLRGSLNRAAEYRPAVRRIAIDRNGFNFDYAVPPEWDTAADEVLADLKAIVAELWRVLSELTGTVVVRQLARRTRLEECDLVPKTAC